MRRPISVKFKSPWDLVLLSIPLLVPQRLFSQRPFSLASLCSIIIVTRDAPRRPISSFRQSSWIVKAKSTTELATPTAAAPPAPPPRGRRRYCCCCHHQQQQQQCRRQKQSRGVKTKVPHPFGFSIHVCVSLILCLVISSLGISLVRARVYDFISFLFFSFPVAAPSFVIL